MGKQYAIIRTKKLKDRAKVTAAASHNLRTGKTNHNVDSEKSHMNMVLVDTLQAKSGKDFRAKLEAFYASKDAKIKANNVLAMEFVLTASPSYFEGMSQADIAQWIEVQKEFVAKEFGDNLLLLVAHLDEKTPHIHCFLSTNHTTTKKYKNRYGESEKTTTSLNAKRFDRNYLIGLQTRFAEHNKIFGLVRGAFHSKAKHTTLKEFYRMVNNVSADETEELKKVIEKLKAVEVQITQNTTPAEIMKMVIKALKEDIYLNAKMKSLLDLNSIDRKENLKNQIIGVIEDEIKNETTRKDLADKTAKLKKVAAVVMEKYKSGNKPEQ